MNFPGYYVKELPAVINNVRIDRIIKIPATSHDPLNPKNMASVVAITINNMARDCRANCLFLYKIHIPTAMKRVLNTVPAINRGAPRVMGSTRMPQVFSRAGSGYVEKMCAFTKINIPRSTFRGPMVFCKVICSPGASWMNSVSESSSFGVLISTWTLGEMVRSVGLESFMETVLLSFSPINTGQTKPPNEACARLKNPYAVDS